MRSGMNIENTLEIQHHHDSYYELGKKQWEILDTLVQKYTAMDITSVTHNHFTDAVWVLSTSGDTTTISFDKHLPPSTYLPMNIFLKILVVILMRDANYSAGSMLSIRGFINNFIPYIENKGSPLLKATRNSAWLPFSEMETIDLSFMLETLAISKDARPTLVALNWMEKYQDLPDLAPFVQGLITPWSIEGISATQWHDRLKNSISDGTSRKPYNALPDETVANIVTCTMLYLQGVSASKDLGQTFENSTSSTSPFTDLLRVVRRLASESPLHTANKAVSISRDKEFIKLTESLNDSLNNMNLSTKEALRNSSNAFYKNTITSGWFTSLFENAQQAAIWIVALTTGLRNCDLRNLKSDCLQYSKRFSLWFLKANIQKTNNTIYIPVGEPTVKAVKLLKWLRFSQNSEYLIQKKVFSFHKKPAEEQYKIESGGSLNRRLHWFAKFRDISLDTIAEDDLEATCHCIRATLASYIGRHSSIAILILKKLFGHSNNLMPDQYIRHNVFVRKQREQQLEKMHSDTAHDIASSIANKEVAGSKGEELLKGAVHLEEKIRLENDSLTEMDVHKKMTDVLKEIILNDIKNEQTQTLLTPMGVICMRATNHSTDSPCAATINKAERDKAGVSRAMFGALPQLPNPAQCIGLDCSDALATKTHSLPLLEQFDWYTNVYRQCTDENRDIDEDAQHFIDTYYPIVMANNLLIEAESFRKKYGPTLRQLYAVDKPAGYFDV